ncbi:MAG: hypothetical protein NTX33_05475 [Propionibacteriales bacterium]|nr:hypothetical protein [Propionibacteriales bacterium]
MRISGSRWLVVATAVLVLIAAALAGWAVISAGRPAGPEPVRAPVAVVAPEARSISVTAAVSSLAVLRDWDRARADAWAVGDVDALRRLYVRGSEAGRADVAMLRQWSDRGVRVEGMSMQVLAVELRARTARRVVLVVTDRLVGAEAVAPGGAVALPRDRATTRRLVFRKVGGSWLVAGAKVVE